MSGLFFVLFAPPDDLLAAGVDSAGSPSPEPVVVSALEPGAALAVFAAFFLGFFFFVIGAEHSEFGKPRHEKERAKSGNSRSKRRIFAKTNAKRRRPEIARRHPP